MTAGRRKDGGVPDGVGVSELVKKVQEGGWRAGKCSSCALIPEVNSDGLQARLRERKGEDVQVSW